MSYGYDDDDAYRYSDPLGGVGGLSAGLGGLDGIGSGGLYNDDLALGPYNSGLDGIGEGGLGMSGGIGGIGSGLDPYDSLGTGVGAGGIYDDPLAGQLGGLSLDSGLDGYNGAGGLDYAGLGGALDSGYGGGYGGLSGDFAVPEADVDYIGTGLLNDPAYGLTKSSLNDPGYDLDTLGSTGLGAGGLGASLGGGLAGGLDGYGLNHMGDYGLGTRGLDPGLDSGLDTLGSGGLNGLGGYGGGLDGAGDLGFDSFGGAGSIYGSNYDLGFGLDDIGSGLEGLGWSSYDSGLDALGGYGAGYGNDLLGDAALAVGGAALGGAALGAAASYYGTGGGHHDHYDRGLGGGLGTGLDYYGNSMYDNDLGILGNTGFGYGTYDGYGCGSGIGSPAMRYSDLANFENRLYADPAIGQAERQSIMADRMAWEALDDSARLSQWNNWDDGYRSRLGLSDGYWGSRYGSDLYGNHYGSGSWYDPMYAAYGWSTPSTSDWSGLSYSYGYGAPTFYNNASLSAVPYSLTAPVRNYYGNYINSWDANSLPYWSDDSRWREAADLAYYQQKLSADHALSEAERMRRWQQRLEWEALDQDARRMRWSDMAEDQRERLGLGLIGSYYGGRYGSRGIGMSLPFELPTQLRSLYSPYMNGQGLSNIGYMDTNYARYNDLVAWANALRYDQSVAQAERQSRWRERMQWEMLDEAQRRSRWGQMPYKQRALLGLNGGFWDSRYGLGNFYDPRALRPMRFPVSRNLARVFKPYQSKTFLARALREGQEGAIAFADLVAFENALRADRRLRAKEKLQRWRARIRWQEMNERERRLRYFQMQEAERRMLGLGLSSFFGRRYAAPLLLNGTRGLPPPRTHMPNLRTALPDNLRTTYAPVMARQPMMRPVGMMRQPVMGTGMVRQPLLSTSELSRSRSTEDPAKSLADRIRYSLASKAETMPGLDPAQRLAATEQKRRILRDMDADRALNTNIALGENERMRSLRSLGY